MSSVRDDNPWDSYYDSQFTGSAIKYCTNCDIQTGKNQYFLKECKFYGITNRVINFNSMINTLFLHNLCTFDNCSSSQDGACIKYYSGGQSSIVQRKFCCMKCQCQVYGHFSMTYLQPDDLNYFIEGCLADVGNEVGEISLDAETGNKVVSSFNFSTCISSTRPAGYFSDVYSNYLVKYNYSTIVNNKATASLGPILEIWFNALIDSCNIINNTMTQSTTGLIYHLHDSMTIEGCSFINNRGPTNSYLIQNDDETIMNKCYIDDSFPNTFSDSLKATTSNSRTEFTNNLTYFCNHYSNLNNRKRENAANKPAGFSKIFLIERIPCFIIKM